MVSDIVSFVILYTDSPFSLFSGKIREATVVSEYNIESDPMPVTLSLASETVLSDTAFVVLLTVA
jgi:hypothetical protein